MVIANFKDGYTTARIEGLWQWDYGQILRIQGLDLPTAVEIHFSFQEKGGEALPVIGVTKDGVTEVEIPNMMLERNTTQKYGIYAFVYTGNETSGQTKYKITMNVNARPRPVDMPDQSEMFKKAIAEVNKAADRAEAAEDKAEEYALQAGESVDEIRTLREEIDDTAESVAVMEDNVRTDAELALQYKTQAQTAVTNALQSERNAKASETAALEARAGAEVAVQQAEAAAQKAKDVVIDYITTKRIEMTAEDTVVELEAGNHYYVFPEMSSLKITAIKGEGELHFFFTSGETPTKVNLPDRIDESDCIIFPNKIYEFSILNNVLMWDMRDVV